jgi:hypothetical protein
MNERTIERTVRSIFAEGSLHAKRILSLGHAVVGVMHAAQAGVASIGRALAVARRVSPKHAIKQFDRFLSNPEIDLTLIWISYLGFVIGHRSRLVVSLDWTDYADGTQHRIALNLVTRHGRATPLIWKTVTAKQLTKRRNEHEDELLRQFKWLMPSGVEQVTVLADRGFGDVALYEELVKDLSFDFVIRFRGCIDVRASTGERRSASGWVPSNGRALRLSNARVTGQLYEVGAVVVVKRAAMKDGWHLATSLGWQAERIVKLYGRRFTIEENFRDEKDWRYGLGSRYVNIRRTDRRDRLCLVIAIATVLLTLLGQAGEHLGLDRALRANTVRRRTHSLFRQGREYLRGALGRLKDGERRLAAAFRQLLAAQRFATDSAGII